MGVLPNAAREASATILATGVSPWWIENRRTSPLGTAQGQNCALCRPLRDLIPGAFWTTRSRAWLELWRSLRELG